MGRPAGVFLAAAAAAAGALAVSGASSADPRTPAPVPGQPQPFLGTAVIGDGRLLGAIDAYGDLVDLRAPGPAGEAQINNPFARQAAGSVPAGTGVVAAVAIGSRPLKPLWHATRLRQRYLPGTNVLLTSADVAGVKVRIADAARGERWARRALVRGPLGQRVRLRLILGLDPRIRMRCAATPGGTFNPSIGGRRWLSWKERGIVRAEVSCGFRVPPGGGPRLFRAAIASDRGWLARRRPLGRGAPAWARRMYSRSLLVLRALTARRSGAVVAGARDRWAYVWPRDAGTAAIALNAAGYQGQAGRIVAFLRRLDLDAGARFSGNATAVADGPALPGDGGGWIAAAERAVQASAWQSPRSWRRRGDYRERAGDRGDYLGNAIAAGVGGARIRHLFDSPEGLVRSAGDAASGLDPAAAWAVRPFPRPALFGLVHRTITSPRLGTRRYGTGPSPGWPGGGAWTAPVAWSAWSLAALGDRHDALVMLAILRRDRTPAGTLPERVSPSTGLAVSTTPLGWTHSFAVLALRELYPEG